MRTAMLAIAGTAHAQSQPAPAAPQAEAGQQGVLVFEPAFFADARPDTTCITYLGGREDNELESARLVASRLGLRHEALVCDPGRAFDRNMEVAGRLPLLTAEVARLSYADLATEVRAELLET